MSFAPTRKGNRVYRYYRCCRATKRGRSTCPTGCLSADKVEAFVVDQIRRIGASPELQRATFEQVVDQAAADRRGLKAEAKRLDRQITTGKQTVERLVHELPQVKGEAKRAVAEQLEKEQGTLRGLEARLVKVRDALASLEAHRVDEADVAKALRDFDELWKVPKGRVEQTDHEPPGP